MKAKILLGISLIITLESTLILPFLLQQGEAVISEEVTRKGGRQTGANRYIWR
jgi:hypothetical protein